MANRVLRDWTTSESLSEISAEGERLFTRLIMKADDYGSFFSNAKLIKAALFPLMDVKDALVSKWIDECIEAGLIFKYKVEGKEYIRIKNFNQRLRNMRGTFPQPDDNHVQQVAADRVTPPPETETKRNEEETETETKVADADAVTVWPSFEDFWALYGKRVDKPKCEAKWKKINQGAREKIFEHLPLYIAATPDAQYRKNPLKYLTNESWNDEIITSNEQPPDNRKDKITGLKANFAKRVMQGNN